MSAFLVSFIYTVYHSLALDLFCVHVVSQMLDKADFRLLFIAVFYEHMLLFTTIKYTWWYFVIIASYQYHSNKRCMHKVSVLLYLSLVAIKAE